MLNYVIPNSEHRNIIILVLLTVPVLNNFVSISKPWRIDCYCLYSPCPKHISNCLLLFPGKHHKYKVPIFAFISQCIFLIAIIALLVLDIIHISLPYNVIVDLPKWIICYNIFVVFLLNSDAFIRYLMLNNKI